MRRTFLSSPDLEIFACRHPDVSEGNFSKGKWMNYKRRACQVQTMLNNYYEIKSIFLSAASNP